jgi:hypothetical protein
MDEPGITRNFRRFALILFLDFDGVLHAEPSARNRMFEHAGRLARVVEAYPEVAVVLSTSWRTNHAFVDLLLPLPRVLRSRVLGVTPIFGDFTPHAPLSPYRRHAECDQWLRAHQLSDSPWLALDDRPGWFAPYCENLIECDPTRGFDEIVAARLASVLQMSRERNNADLDLILA